LDRPLGVWFEKTTIGTKLMNFHTRTQREIESTSSGGEAEGEADSPLSREPDAGA